MCELAFIPPHHVIEDFQEQKLNNPIRNINGDKLDELLFYFRDTYIGRSILEKYSKTSTITCN